MDEIPRPQRGIISGFEKAGALDVPPVNEYAAVRPATCTLAAVWTTRLTRSSENLYAVSAFQGELVGAALSE